MIISRFSQLVTHRDCALLLSAIALLLPDQRATAQVDFNEDIRPIFNKHCVGCHGGVKKAAELSFLSRKEALGKAKSGFHAIVPGNPNASELLQRITSNDPEERMPPAEHGAALDEEVVATLRQWIQEGAEWREHWAFEPPVRPAIPKASKDSSWAQSPIDHFILQRLQEEALDPSPPADKESLLRRVSFDLTGLPPTIKQLNQFLSDNSPEAFITLVDELLDSPAFGERWTAMWLDLARYADSEGLGIDGRRNTWAYRDWLIRAFNDNKRFDTFVIEQLAGDLLPRPTTDQLIATAFHRQTQSNGEGGTDDEEFRVAAILDRTSTTWEVFQGVTFGCVQCHSHPYDPINNEEFYDFMAFFNNTADADLGDHWPTLRVPLNRSDNSKEQELRERIELIQEELASNRRELVQQTEWESPAAEAVRATGEGTGVRVENHEGSMEFRSVGNVSGGAEFTFEFAVPEDIDRLTALRIDMMPVDEKSALHTPEWSGILSRIRLGIHDPSSNEEGEAFTKIGLAEVIGDEANPVYDPNESLKKGGAGFGAMSKIFHRRTCVVLPVVPMPLKKGSTLQLKLRHDIKALGAFPLITQRGSFSITDDIKWIDYQEDTRINDLRAELEKTRGAYNALPATTIPVMRDRPHHLLRESRLFTRGNWLEKGALVSPDVPESFPPLPAGVPKDRLAMAQWLVSPNNPLTARVAVNRFWEQLFGYGIVLTLEDFGSAGEKPSHPQLLDWLALHFQQDLGWNIKALLKSIVLSSTYQQTAVATAKMHERDPQNRLLSRGPRRRLKSEMIRDFALSASSLLSSKQFGPPVRPPIPDGVWKPFSNDPWKTDEDEDRFRRSIYIYWKRSIPFPSMVTFDAPSRELCNQRRLPSNTPLQALVTLNDPVFVESANALAERMRSHHKELREQLRFGYRLGTSHTPRPEQLNQLVKLHERVLASYRNERPEGVDDFETATLQAVASVLLNLDESLNK